MSFFFLFCSGNIKKKHIDLVTWFIEQYPMNYSTGLHQESPFSPPTSSVRSHFKTLLSPLFWFLLVSFTVAMFLKWMSKVFLNYLSVFCFPFCSGNSDRISIRPHWRHIGMQSREYLLSDTKCILMQGRVRSESDEDLSNLAFWLASMSTEDSLSSSVHTEQMQHNHDLL